MSTLQGYQRHLTMTCPTTKPSTHLASTLAISPLFAYGIGRSYESSPCTGKKGSLIPHVSFAAQNSSGSQPIWKDENSFGNLSSKTTPSRAMMKKLECWNYDGHAGGDLPDRAALASLEQAIQFQEKEETRLFFCGPPTGDVAEVEAFCRLYRLAEHLHSTVMKALRSYSAIETPSLVPDRGDVSLVEENVASGLAHLMALLHEGKSEVLGVVPATRAKLMQEASVDDLPTFALFRREVRECCKSLEDALESLLPTDSDQGLEIQKRVLKLKNACLDAGFPRPEGIPSHADIPNFAPVRLFPSKSARTLYKEDDVSFWRGGNITDSGLEWLVEKGFKTIVDLREESEQPVALRAVAAGKLRVVTIPIERGRAPSKEQVKEFARLVADVANKPLYLRTRAGVGRASAMVSRWREFVLRAQLQKVSASGTLTSELELLSVEDVRISQEDALALEIALSRSGSGPFSSKLPSVPQEDSSGDVAVPFESNPASTSGSEVVTSANSGASITMKDDRLLSSNVTANAFEAQRPLTVLSRKAMSKFMKRKKVPAAYFSGRMDRATGNLPVARVERVVNGSIAGPANRWGLAGPGIPRADSRGVSRQQNWESEPKQGEESPSYNETLGKSNGNARRNLGNGDATNSEKEMESNERREKVGVNSSLTSSRVRDNGALIRVSGDRGVIDEAEEPVRVEGDMCASTTGVVRLQSRKKAEMFLVRTDGYSCTRERVKESTLAFTHPSTQQQMLMWKTPPRTVLLLKKLGSELMKETQEVVAFLHHQEGMNVVVEPEVHDQLARMPGFGFVQTFYSQDTGELHERVDFVVCLGGDGVILHASNLFRNAVPPVVSFNLGSLGFLTSHNFEDHKQDLQAVIHGHENMMTGVYITLRMRLRCELFRNGKAVPGKVFDVLNEVVVDRGSNPYLCKIECYEHNHLITKVQADGVIVATPTGSTAYSTAAGGSMVHPNVPCMLFTPICPHSLSFRPVVLPDSALLELKVPRDARNSAWVSFDGKKRQQLSKGDSVRICMSEHPLPTVNKSNQTDDWFQSLVRCLNWNERLEQRPLYMI